MIWLHGAILSLAGMALKVFAELDGVECPHPGEVKTHVQKDTLFCDRYGRRVNFNNKFCRQYIKNEPTYGRLIFDEEDGSSDDKKQAGRFPDLCLPGEYYKVYKGTWTCSCQQTQEPGVHKFRCILAEDQLSPQQLGRDTAADNSYNVTSVHGRARLPPGGPSGQGSAQGSAQGPAQGPAQAMGMATPSSTPATPMGGDSRFADHHNETLASLARDSYFTYFSVVTFCSQFSYWINTVNCQVTKEVLSPGRARSETDILGDFHEFDAYECLPGSISDKIKCRRCYGPEMYGHCEDQHNPCPPH